MGRLLTIDEVAELTRVPANTLRYWRHRGTGPTAARIGKRLVYQEDEVNTWIEKQFSDQAPAVVRDDA
jgi:excisionase family DNA binding protein